MALRAAQRSRSASGQAQSYQARQQLLWEGLFSNPSEWWDYRHDKRAPAYPDFRHKSSREPLWLNNLYKPPWVDSKLASLAQHQHEQVSPNPSFANDIQTLSAHLGHRIEALCLDGELDKALSCLVQVDISPPARIYLSLLKLCQKREALAHALHVLAHLALHGWDLTSSLGDSLVFTLAKCGGLEDALHIFNNLPCRTVFAWTSMIAGYAKYGQGQEALRMHACMREDGVEPDQYTFASLFKACGSIPDLEEGKKLHVEAQEKGFTLDVYVGSTLVSMYGKCGDILEAESVFCGLSKRNIVSWNAMLSAYAEQGQGKKAILLYRQMQEEGEYVNEVTFVIALQACGIFAGKEEAFTVEAPSRRVVALEICHALHADARKKNFDSHAYIFNTLVSMYGKCGSLGEAENVFNGMSQSSVVSWNAMLLAYVEQGQGDTALQFHKQMQEEDISPDQHTFVVSLQACCILAEEEEAIIVEGQATKEVSLDISQALHLDAERKGFTSDAFVVSTLVSAYGKCGIIKEAENMFHKLYERDVVSWSAMISAYVEQGHGDRALQAYRQMQEEGVSTDQHTLVIALQACGTLAEMEESVDFQGCSTSMMSLEIGHALHADARRKGFASYASVCNTLVSMYGKCGTIVEAEHVLNGLSQRNVVSWNAMLSAYVEQGQVENALQLYQEILEENMIPDELTFLITLQACGVFAEKEEAVDVEGQLIKLAPLEIGQALHADAWRAGFSSQVFVRNTLVNMYIKCGNLAEALEVFNSLPQQDVVAWNAILSAFVEHGQGDMALQLYRQMQDDGVAVQKVTLVYVLQACSETSCLEISRQLHFSFVSAGYDLSPIVANTLIHVYGSCANLDDAQTVFDGLFEPNVVSWNACLAGHARQGNCLHFLEKMELTGISPNGATFLSLLSACSHAGHVHKGVEYFESMRRDHRLTPDKNHHAIMIDLLGRAGDFKHVEDILWRIPMQTNLSIWLRLLGVCRTHSNVKLGKLAFHHAAHLHPEKATSYVWMSNIYAAAGIEESVGEEENPREQEGAWSLPGPGWVESEQELQTSIVGDHMHPQENCVCNLLCNKSVEINEKTNLLHTLVI